jgi:heme exporter protein B
MPRLFAQTLAVLRKDVLVEWQGRGRVFATVAFAVTVLLLFSFAAGPDGGQLAQHAAGYLWLAILLASVLALSESFRTEIEDNALSTLVLLPVDPRALFLGKALANALLLTVLATVLLPFTFVLFDTSMKGCWAQLIAVLGLGALGLSAPGTLYAAMTAQARGRDVMLPLLLFPLVVPVLVAAVKGTSLVFGGDPMGQLSSWLALLGCFDLVYWSLCPLLFGRVLEQ